MTIRERPRIDREKQCREERARRKAQALFQQSLDLLGAGETLGTPRREADHLIVPIIPIPEAALESDPASMKALMTAWLDEPVG